MTPARPYIGGQAVIEGVMMRSPASISIVCRRRSGELVVREKPIPKGTGGTRSWPLLRGVHTLVESLKLGSQALRWSAELYEHDLEEAEGAASSAKKKAPSVGGKGKVLSALALSIAALATQTGEEEPLEPEIAEPEEPAPQKRGFGAILPILFAIVLFVALPQLAAEGINKLFHLGLEVTAPLYQVITGAAKLAIVVGYLVAIRSIPEVRRVFQYHGAEHKTISTYEAGEDLVVANARAKTTLHPRCGTTFLVMVALVSIVVFTMIGSALPVLPGNRVVQGIGFFCMKLPFLPVIAALTYELQRFFARYCTTGAARALLWPGFLVQKITTAEPDDTQLEVALASLQATLWREAAVDAPQPPDRVFADYDSLLADPGYAPA